MIMKLLKKLNIIGIHLTCVFVLNVAEASATKPNVLFIICDDLNDWVLHPTGHPNVKTPNMDRLRNRSINFSNAHVVVPVCGPSRKCLFSGLYPQTYAAMIRNHRAQLPQQCHEILGRNSTGHKSFEASEAVSRGDSVPADKKR